MMMRALATATILSCAAIVSTASHAAEDAVLLKDLTAVIMLLGLPCGQVVSAQRQADKDQVAVCANGNRYRVFVNAGRVVAQKQ